MSANASRRAARPLALAAALTAGARAAEPPAAPATPEPTAAPAPHQDATPILSAFDDGVQELKDATSWATPDGDFRLSLDFWFTNDLYVMSLPPPGFIQSGSQVLDAPRLSGLFTASILDHFDVVFLGNVDRGFDPQDCSIQARADEYFGVYTPFDDPVLRLKGGTFATCFGQWVNRHFSFQNPLITAPLMYDWEGTVADGMGGVSATPPLPAFLNRKNLPTNVPAWLPIVWGPSYASGAGANGHLEWLDWAFEVKNASLSSRPSEWAFWERSLAYPTVTGRLGVRPSAEWTLGVSASSGSYLSQDAIDTLPSRFDASDATQRVLGADVSWAHGPFEVWSEMAFSTWTTPTQGALTSFSWFVEGRWKLTPELWLAGRFNQQVYDDIASPFGQTPWANDVWRAEAGIGMKLGRFILLKAQYSRAEEQGPVRQGQDLGAFQLVILF
ncbi:MAG: hypothetical protein U0574_01650 [Phycisphaerales bacterium]